MHFCMQIDVRYWFKIEDFVEVLEVADKPSPRPRRIRFGAKFVACLLLVAPFLTSSGPSHPDQFLLGMSATAIFLLGWGLVTPKRIARKYYDKQIDGTEYEASITADGIRTISPTSRAEFQWGAFSKSRARIRSRLSIRRSCTGCRNEHSAQSHGRSLSTGSISTYPSGMQISELSDCFD